MWTTTDLLDRSDYSDSVFTTDNPGTTVITHMITKVRSKRSPNYKENLLKNPVPIPKKNIGSYLNPTTNRIEPQRYTDIVEEDEIRGDILMDVTEEKLKMNFLHHICISSRYDMVEITKNTLVFMTTTLPI